VRLRLIPGTPRYTVGVDRTHAHSRTLTASEIEEIRRYVREHLAQAIQVDDLAAIVGMSNVSGTSTARGD